MGHAQMKGAATGMAAPENTSVNHTRNFTNVAQAGQPDYAAHMDAVAIALLGEPDERKPHELRYGTRGSLSINTESGTWYDHEAGNGGGVLDLIERETGNGGRAAIEWLERQSIIQRANENRPAPRKRFNVVAAYDYFDADGVLQFQVCRLDPKDFRQRRPDGKGGWSWSIKGVQPVPYRLPQLLAQPDAPVFIVEGEKDADNLAALGIVATCNAGGANKWRTELTPYFKGRDVVILPDNDDAGRAHAALVSSKLQGVAASVRVLALPDLPEKGDVSDWLAAGHTADELVAMANDAPAPANDNVPRPRNSFEALQALERHGVYLSTNARNEPYTNLENAMTVLQGHPRFAGSIWYDTFHQAILTTWDCETPRQWVDADRLRVAAVFQRDFGLAKFGDELVEKAAIAVAHDDQRDELRDWLKSLRWDGTPRLDAWMQYAIGAPDDAYHAAMGRNFIMSMAARGMTPGCKVDTMPVFEGAQGAGKSRLLAILGGNYYAELTESLDTKDFFVVIQGKWLVEIAELDAFRRSDVTRIKQALSSHQDRCRLPYGKHAVDLPRRVVFAGTTNEHEYLRDHTGARRFWPVTVGSINHGWMVDNRAQLFAEAVERLRAGGTWWDMPADEARRQSEARRETDPWEDAIGEFCVGRRETTVPEVLSRIGVDIAKQGKSEQMRASRVLTMLGYQRKRLRRAGTPTWVWINGAEAEQPY